MKSPAIVVSKGLYKVNSRSLTYCLPETEENNQLDAKDFHEGSVFGQIGPQL